jgi:hypothetical protein
MTDYKTNLKNWVEFALDVDHTKWNRENLTKAELAELLAILAGYYGATEKGRELTKGLL